MHVLKQLMNYWIHLTILILRKKPHNGLLSVISEILNLKVSNVDIAWSQHDNNKDVETDSSFFFFTLLNLSENYFHKSQTNKCHGNVNGGNIHTSSAGYSEWHDISAFQILHTRHTILCSSCGGNLRAQFTDQPDFKRYTVLCKQAHVNSRLRHF